MIEISSGNLSDARILSLLRHHFDRCIEVTPKGSAHVFDVSQLRADDVDFWAAWDCNNLVGVGAVKYLATEHGEVKSMHTAEAARGQGVGRAMLKHIIETARAKGIRRLSLETGSFDFFRPAVSLYRSHGFIDCEPFGDYKADPNSVFLSKCL